MHAMPWHIPLHIHTAQYVHTCRLPLRETQETHGKALGKIAVMVGGVGERKQVHVEQGCMKIQC